VDLDQFRATLWRGFEGNYIEGYHRAFNMPFTAEDLQTTWLEADVNAVAPIVITRTPRYRHPEPEGWARYQQMATDAQLAKHGVFVGVPSEHDEFVRETGVAVPFYPTRDFLELANVVAGAELVVTNQSFVFSIAMGLGKAAVCETYKIKPIQYSECYFPRPNVQYW
jgi:ADP-heptose:LPS heptosyltransferase